MEDSAVTNFAHNAIVTLVGPEGDIVTRFSSDAVIDDLAGALRSADRSIRPALNLTEVPGMLIARSACAAVSGVSAPPNQVRLFITC
jgi:hypothetical protein